ncbi:MAG: flagellar motor protein MotB [Halieaceae bacterium]|jgi:flagellar motor protein MotB
MKRWLSFPLRWIGWAYLLYLTLALFLILPALNVLAPRLIKEQFNRDFRSELILFNPFSLALEARRASLSEKGGHQPLAFKILRVNLSISSLWEPGIVLDELLLDELDIHLLRHADGRFHFDDLLTDEREDDDKIHSETAAVPGITIRRIEIDAHTLRYTDATRPGPFSTALRDINIRTNDLSTVPEHQGDGELLLIGETGGELRWRGDMDIADGRSSGSLTLKNIDLTHAWRYNAGDLAFVTQSARFDADLNYRVSWSGEPQVEIDGSRLRLHATDIVPADANTRPNTRVSLDEIVLDGISVRTVDRTLAISTLGIAGLHLEGYDENSDISLVEMFMPPAPGGGEEEADTAPGEPPQSDDAGTWTLTLDSMTLADSSVSWRTMHLAPEVMRIEPITFSARGLRWPALAPADFELALAVNGESELDLSSTLHIGSGDGDLSLDLQRWQLEWLNPLVNQQARTDIRRGSVSVNGTAKLNAFAPQQINGELQVLDLATELQETGEIAFALAQLAVNKIQVDIPAQTVRIASVELQKPAGSLHILEDGRVNINGVIRGAEEADSPQDAVAEEEGENTAQDPSKETSTPGWVVQIDHTALREGRLDFADDSLPLPFKVMIESIDADLNDLDSNAVKPLNVKLTGAVDGYAPVLIEGSGNPFAESPDGELAFSFRGIDIATMSAYSGTYAGYAIDSGSLSLTLGYRIDGSRLDGENHIVISQMQLGDRIESDRALDIPLKLGLALLTDTRGVIDLSVPISGSVDDPEFSLGGVIGKAIANVIIKAVTAPFSLLASLVGSDEDLENIAYEAGSAALSGNARKSLGALAGALAERPQLRLQVAGGADPVEDRSALQWQQLRESMLSDGLTEVSIDTRDESLKGWLDQRYQQLGRPLPAASEDEQSLAQNIVAQIAELKELVSLTPGALPELATARAAAAKRELVNAGAVDAARVAISYDPELRSAGIKMLLDG